MKQAASALTIVNLLIFAFLLFFGGSILVSIIGNTDSGWLGAVVLGVISYYGLIVTAILCVPMVFLVKKLSLRENKLYFYTTLGNLVFTLIIFIIAMSLL